MTPVYLDYNATTPVAPEVVQAMLPYFTEIFGNPSSAHTYGRSARQGVDTARQQVADLIGSSPSEVIFTGCATESNNIALLGLAQSAPSNKRHIVTSAIEHPAVVQPCVRLQKEGWNVSFLPVDQQGWLEPDTLRRALRADTAFVSIMHANNEIGTIQPIEDISRITREHNIPLHVDAAQSLGKISVQVRELGVDLLTIAGHKFYAPKGIGALYIRQGIHIPPLTCGADHEHGMRPGTENVPLIVGLGEACHLAKQKLGRVRPSLTRLRDHLHSLLIAAIPDLTLNGHPTERLPNTLNISFPANAKQLLHAVNSEVAASLGSACHSANDAISGVLAALGADRERAMGAVRFSVGVPTTEDDIAQAAQAIVNGHRLLLETTQTL